MKKLDDLPNRVDYKVPDGYFDSLPTRIQSRINAGKEVSRPSSLGLSLRYALPLIALLAIGIVWYDRSNDSVAEQLESIDESALAMFLEEADLTSEELVDNMSWSTEDLDALEEEVYNALDPSGEGLDVVIDEMDLENL